MIKWDRIFDMNMCFNGKFFLIMVLEDVKCNMGKKVMLRI